MGCSPWGREESDMTERLHFHFSLSCIGEGNGNPLQCSCLVNPRDEGVWWAAVYGVAQSRTRLKRLSSSSSSRGKGELGRACQGEARKMERKDTVRHPGVCSVETGSDLSGRVLGWQTRQDAFPCSSCHPTSVIQLNAQPVALKLMSLCPCS